MARVLSVDDEEGIREFVAEVLREAGHDVAQAADAGEALGALEDGPFDLMLVDLKMPGELSGMDVLRRARAEWPDMQVIVLTAHGSVSAAVDALKLGAFDFLEKPIASPAELRRLAARALNWRATPKSQRTAVAPAEIAIERRSGACDGARGGLRGLLWQLKRRHVYNAAATYAAGGFIVLQGAELLLPALPVPGWSYTALAGAVIAGFPVALMLGWIYDISATGLRRTDAAPLQGRRGGRA
jgi:CheY-like chemotaxis protein